MSVNLLVWRWSADYDTLQKRKKLKVGFAEVARAFIENKDNSYFGALDSDGFMKELQGQYGADPERRPFIIETHPKCLVFNIANRDRLTLVPAVGNMAIKHGLNGAEV